MIYRRFARSRGFLIVVFTLIVSVFAFTVLLDNEYIKSRGFKRGYSGERETISPGGYESEFTIEFQGGRRGGAIVIITIFAIVSSIFIPLGIIMADCFGKLPPLTGYTINIMGSLTGTIAFLVISFLRAPPFIWFFIGFALLLWFVRQDKKKFYYLTAIVTILLISIFLKERQFYWSPYYKIRTSEETAVVDVRNPKSNELVATKEVLTRINIFVNHTYHQAIINMGVYNDKERMEDFLNRLDIARGPNIDPYIGFFRRYNNPFQRYFQEFRKTPDNVLIIAAGCGNEAAAAIRHGVKEIDAVEIEPGIIEIGRKMHPEKPYHNPTVRVINTDARAFLQRTDKKYDLIVMNVVDSHSQYATSTGLRLDSYIYTIESFEQIRDHLSDEGAFIMEASGYHWGIPWSFKRHMKMIESVFGSPGENTGWGAGGPLLFIRPMERQDDSLKSSRDGVLAATDDWPQFYLHKRAIPGVYVIIIVIILLISVSSIYLIEPDITEKLDLHFFFLGFGFMLLEIKSITHLSLLFGATWVVNSIVISAILCAIVIANLVVERAGGVDFKIGYFLLFCLLILSYSAHRWIDLLSLSIFLRIVVSSLLLGAPLFCAGLVFADSFKKTDDSGLALGANLLGAMAGGFGEYVSLITGVRNLLVVAFIVYILSFLALLASLRRKRNQ